MLKTCVLKTRVKGKRKQNAIRKKKKEKTLKKEKLKFIRSCIFTLPLRRVICQTSDKNDLFFFWESSSGWDDKYKVVICFLILVAIISLAHTMLWVRSILIECEKKILRCC